MCSDLDPGPYLKGQRHMGRVRAITYLCIDGIPYNLVQLFSYLRCCAVTLTRVQSTRSCFTFKGHCTHVCVRARTYLCIEASAGDITVLWTALCGLSSLLAVYDVAFVSSFCTNDHVLQLIVLVSSHNR